MRSPSRLSGFSLVELLIALAASVFVMLGAAVLLKSQYRAFQSSSSERAFQETGRIALDAITTDLRQAGLGVDPGLVFDFGPMANARAAAGPIGSSFATVSLDCGAAVTCRDSIAGPDELVFLSRDPSFGKPLRAAATATSTTLTVAGPLNTALHQGQILQVICYSGNMPWAYVQVGSSVAASAAATVDIPIAAANGTTFPTQNGLLADSCFSTVASADPATIASAAKVFKVDRFRYFIQSYTATGDVVAWGTAGSRPWLMLDRGTVDTNDGDRAQIDPVAPDVEDLQVAYVFPTDEVTPVVGATAGALLTSSATGIDLAAACPVSSDDIGGPNRLTHHPGNIRAVQVAVVVRSAEPNLQLNDAATLPAALNRPALAAPDGYLRLLLQTSVPVRNLDARAPYYPFYGTGADQLNVGGG
jgi:type II secretory pathway pseudopilin PulG